MALRRKNNVAQISTAGGLGDLPLIANIQGRRTFGEVLADGDQVYVDIRSTDQTEWEITLATYNAGADSLSRADTPLDSSNAGAKVNFLQGVSKVIGAVLTAEEIVSDPISLATSELTISAGAVAPVRSEHTVDTEADAATDDLDLIDAASMPDGALLLLAAANTDRTVVLKHQGAAASGTQYPIHFGDGVDFPLDDTRKWVLLKQRGQEWQEVAKSSTPASTALAAYPVGSIYLSVLATSPATLFGGTWEQVSQGRFPIGAGTGTDVNSVQRTFANGATGGEYDHTLSVSEMPRHNHTGGTDTRGTHAHPYGDFTRDNNENYGDGQKSGNVGERELSRNTSEAGAHSHLLSINHTGDDQPHNNLPPYFVVYMWRRTG